MADAPSADAAGESPSPGAPAVFSQNLKLRQPRQRLTLAPPAAPAGAGSKRRCPGRKPVMIGIHMWPLGFGSKAVVDFLGRL